MLRSIRAREASDLLIQTTKKTTDDRQRERLHKYQLPADGTTMTKDWTPDTIEKRERDLPTPLGLQESDG